MEFVDPPDEKNFIGYVAKKVTLMSCKNKLKQCLKKKNLKQQNNLFSVVIGVTYYLTEINDKLQKHRLTKTCIRFI